jgi:DNA mismatch repair protein MutL
MSIAILPARLANQIAAGEVVERPASVIKELVENSLDAGATTINIEVDKGGVKRIRINDNGVGIAKDELTLALSRHATSKIKELKDLEAINSLGFRGEALASISSVARLTLTSKPKSQATAWQASAEGRDMAVTIQPAAHPDGTTIEVLDLFFNTPARRKFLRTEKTEFTHIDEVIRRIALACFHVTFSLTHNGKIIRQYRAATTKAQTAKRVAMVCGQKFVDNAIEIDCQHDDMVFTGWLTKPSFARNQNDLCYSYVNGRMMRDKLINHAIRQAYADLLPPDTYPAFVLFLSLDHREVDVNVHPAKHEVRFHQSRYVHDFIYAVCHKALMENNQASNALVDTIQHEPELANIHYTRPDYVTPLAHVSQKQMDQVIPNQICETSGNVNPAANHYTHRPLSSKDAVANYQQLMTPVSSTTGEKSTVSDALEVLQEKPISTQFFIMVEQEKYGVFKHQQCLRLLSLTALAYQIHKRKVTLSWQQSDGKLEQGLISQPLLLPVMITISAEQMIIVENFQSLLTLAGIIINVNESNRANKRIQIRQFPALLREQDVSASFISLIDELSMTKLSPIKGTSENDENEASLMISAIAKVMSAQNYSEEQANNLWLTAEKLFGSQLLALLLLNSVPLDLTSDIKQLTAKIEPQYPEG